MQFSIDWDFLIKVILGISTLVMASIALHYKRLEHRKSTESTIDGNAKILFFISRESMLKHLLGMYGRASETDEIWGQSVSGRDYSNKVRDIVLEAASRGVSFRIIANSATSTSSDLNLLFQPLKTAKLVFANDNNLRIQGLSDKECVVALPSTSAYVAVLFRDKEVVNIFKNWFDNRFKEIANSEPVKQPHKYLH